MVLLSAGCDAQNDVIGLIDSSRKRVVEYKYDSWRNVISITGSLASTVGHWAKVAIGVAGIAIGVAAIALTAGAATVVLAASVKMAVTSAAIGAVSGAGVSAVNYRISEESWKGAGKAAVKRAINGAVYDTEKDM